jgi:NAD(P)H-flavin reductase/hemoglobin-like flavoprotein
MMTNAPLAMEYFYSHLFIASPETRAMFPMGMSQMRERVFAALARLVWSMDSPEEYAAYLVQLGRDHRKYGVKDKHYHEFFRALLETAAYFGGDSWSPETETAWRSALEYAARTMQSAAAADAKAHPPWWVGEIIAHERRTETVAVLTIRPDKPLPYQPGQHVPVQVTKWPRVWRPYSIANAPHADGDIRLHVRAVPGGMVSTALVRDATVGDTLLLGPAAGQMTAPDSDGDLLCMAGGTGLAPIKAIIEQVAADRRRAKPRKITLFVGARRQQDLYDLADLRAMESAYPGLRVIPVLSGNLALSGDDENADGPPPSSEPALSDDAGAYGLTGLLPDVVRGLQLFDNPEAFICGPVAMVRQAALLLAAHIPVQQIHHDPLPADQSFLARAAPPDLATDFRQSPLFAQFARPGSRPDLLA